MEKYIPKSVVLDEIKRRRDAALTRQHNLEAIGQETVLNEMVAFELNKIISLIDTLEVKEPASIAYVVTRCEEHSDYVEEVFYDEDKAQAYCDQFKGNENEYTRHITTVKITL